MAHSHHMHREHQVSHRRVHHILKDEPAGAKEHFHGHAFSKVTSKTGAEDHNAFVAGKKQPKRFARGGQVKHSDEAADRKLIKKMISEHEKKEGEGYARGGRTKKGKGHQTNIAIVVPHHPHPGIGAVPGGPIPGPIGPGGPMAKPLMAGPGGPPMAGPGGPPMAGPGGPPGLPPGLPPPPMKRGGRVHHAGGGRIDGEATSANIKKWGKRTSANSYFRGGAATGVGREEKAEHAKRRRK